jgi:Cytochrome c oxidase subunit IV
VKTETRIVLFGACFVGIVAAIYWFTSYEDAGAVLLAVTALAYALLTGYLYLQVRRIRGGPPRAEDLDDGAVSGDVEVGYFPAASVWPAAMALGAVLVALGLVFGYWFFVIAAIVLVGAVIGYAVEAQVPH